MEYIVLPAGFYYVMYFILSEKYDVDNLIIKADFVLFVLSAVIGYAFIKKNYARIMNFEKSIEHFKIIEDDTTIKLPPKLVKRYVYPSIFILVTVFAGALSLESSINVRYYTITSAILIMTFMVSSFAAILYGLDLTSFNYVKVKMQKRPFEKSGIVLKDGDYMRLITNNGVIKINKDIITVVEVSDDKYRYDTGSESDSLRNNQNCVEL